MTYPTIAGLPEGHVLDVITESAVLHRASEPVGVPDESVRQLAADMLVTMYEGRGVGLAAVQVGRHLRMLVLDGGTAERPRPDVMIDPEVLWTKKQTVTMEEGCLSIPGLRIDVTRPSDVKIAYTDIDGVRRTRDLGGWPARIAQHEIDHINGVLISDRRG